MRRTVDGASSARQLSTSRWTSARVTETTRRDGLPAPSDDYVGELRTRSRLSLSSHRELMPNFVRTLRRW